MALRSVTSFTITPRSTFHLDLATSIVYRSLSFFSETSGRRRKRKKRLDIHHPHYRKNEEEEQRDTRTVKDILFPKPYYGPEDDDHSDQRRYPKSIAGWRTLISQVGTAYLRTWDGFLTSKGFIVQDEPASNENNMDLKAKSEEVKGNVNKNAAFVRDESLRLRNEVRKRTGIESVEDLRRIASDLMRLASDCVSEFMKGYRKGRDDEVEKMLTQYFQDLEQEANKPRRRRRKRRVIN